MRALISLYPIASRHLGDRKLATQQFATARRKAQRVLSLVLRNSIRKIAGSKSRRSHCLLRTEQNCTAASEVCQKTAMAQALLLPSVWNDAEHASS